MRWVEPDVREEVISLVNVYKPKSDLPLSFFLSSFGITSSKFFSWIPRRGNANRHNGSAPRKHWITPLERDAIINFAKKNPDEGYRRLTYIMLDKDIAAVSPSTTYRVLKQEDLLNRWNNVKSSSKGTGFIQPQKPHEHWHTDIKYVNYHGTFLFLISVIDGYTRYILHHELRQNMQEYDVEFTLQKTVEKFPAVNPKLITDNGSQFISKDFNEYLRHAGLQHIRTSVNYPQSNGKIERYHRTFHEEFLTKKSLIDLDDARKQVAQFVNFYNTERLHSALFYLTPEDFLLNRIDQRLNHRELKLKFAKQKTYRFAQS
jgi:transposase InsO family protein